MTDFKVVIEGENIFPMPSLICALHFCFAAYYVFNISFPVDFRFVLLFIELINYTILCRCIISSLLLCISHCYNFIMLKNVFPTNPMIKPALHDDWKALLKLCLITMAANVPCRYVSHFALETAHDNLS